MSAFNDIPSLKKAIRDGIAASGGDTPEVTYEKAVSALELKYAKQIAAAARRAVEREEDDVLAADLVSTYLLNDLEWEKVAAVDISDIAYDACLQARREA